MDESQINMIAHLESLPFMEARELVLRNHYGHPGSRNQTLCEGWLAAKEAEAQDANEAENLSISRRALSHAKWSNAIAIVALLVSVVTAIVVAWIE